MIFFLKTELKKKFVLCRLDKNDKFIKTPQQRNI